MTNSLDQTQKLVDEIQKRHGKSIEEIVTEREKRVKDAIELRVPDRVPVVIGTGRFATSYVGIKAKAEYYDPPAYREACKKVMLDFEPDGGGFFGGISGTFLDLLQEKQYKWPGGTLADDVSMQFSESEYMKSNEYDLFLDDPSDFIMRYYLPRISGLLSPLPKISPLRNMIFENLGGLQGLAAVLTSPEFKTIGETLDKAIKAQEEQRKEDEKFSAEMAKYGFPSQGYGGRSIMFTPFDTISDKLRGMRGIFTDIYRQPDKLLEACKRVMVWWKAQCTPAIPDPRGNPRRAGMPLHRGSDGFMSKEQFEKFYWPELKECINFNISLGYVAAPFWEGVWDKRLEYLLELPKGKVIFHCEKTDVFKAKEIIGDHMCIQGGVPPTLLQAGSPQDVEEHVKKLIKVVGKNGGYIVGAGSSIDYAKPANIKAMVDTVKKYGWY
ncbi:MAG: hypothetical protein GX631_10720 [Dehalococcoidales bacterium]|nr:hypothetical protein [Dehalococcoidales bacterium]